MIAGIFHQGSGIGNQLHRYVMTRVLALDKGYEWGMCNPELSKVDSFMKLDKGSRVPSSDIFTQPDFYEKKIMVNGVDVRGYDPEVNFIRDGTLIDGEFQDQRYFEHRMDEIDEWLKVEPITDIDGLPFPEDLCVIGFRGGEYSVFPDLFLTPEYWQQAIEMKRKRNPNMRFEVHTDDPTTAQRFFPDFKIIHDAGINWRAMRYAKHAIIANSSFYILPRLLAHHDFYSETIAPRYWARRNIGVWALPQNYYKEFTYI